MLRDRFFGVAAIVLAGAILVACGGIPTYEERVSADAKSFRDQQLLSYYFPSDPPRQYGKLSIHPETLEFVKSITTKTNASSHTKAIAYYSTQDFSGDSIAIRYQNMARERGNTVRVYKTAVNQEIAKMLPPPDRASIGLTHTDIDQAMIEFDSKGRMQSALYRIPVTALNISSYFCEQYTRIIVGTPLRTVENRLRASFLHDYELAVVK